MTLRHCECSAAIHICGWHTLRSAGGADAGGSYAALFEIAPNIRPTPASSDWRFKSIPLVIAGALMPAIAGAVVPVIASGVVPVIASVARQSISVPSGDVALSKMHGITAPPFHFLRALVRGVGGGQAGWEGVGFEGRSRCVARIIANAKP